MKKESSEAGAIFMKRTDPELCHFYDGFAALVIRQDCRVGIVAIGKPERQVRKASHCGSKQQ